MYTSTRGIVFRQTRYSDTSLVVRIFTERFGLRSFMVKGARSARSKLKASLFQPLSLLQLTVPEKERGELHHIREAHMAYQYRTIYQDINKSSVLLFLNELLYKSIREEAAHEELFYFIYDQMLYLDGPGELSGTYHILFALQLTQYLGFYPQGPFSSAAPVFDLQEGHFVERSDPASQQQISGEECAYFAGLIDHTPEDHRNFKIPSNIRLVLIEKILEYYKLHLPISGEFHSHTVLHEVLKR